nr:response regulator [Paraburkholderia sp. LEh10]
MNCEKRVFIVDDDGLVRRALCRLLGAMGYQAEAFDTAQSFLDNIDLTAGPACVVLDLQLPDMSGLEVQRRLDMRLPIVFITGHGDIGTSVDAMKAGATDFLTKPIDGEVLVEAIKRALCHAKKAFDDRREQEHIQSRLATLTPREREVMTHVVAGRLNKQVADNLGIAEATIKIHRARVMTKMQAESLADLIHLVDKAGERAFANPAPPVYNQGSR